MKEKITKKATKKALDKFVEMGVLVKFKRKGKICYQEREAYLKVN